MLLPIAVASLALAGALIATLTHAEQRRAGTNGVFTVGGLADVDPGARICQPGELLPAGTAALRLVVQADGPAGPPLAVTVRRDGRELVRTRVARGWSGLSAVAPIQRTSRDLDGVEVCFTPGSGGTITVIGGVTPPGVGGVRIDGHEIGGSIAIDYLRDGDESWWAFASTVARRLGLGRGSLGGGWIAWAAAVLVVAAIALAGWLVVRTVVTDRDVAWPRAALVLLAIGTLNAAAWSLITPAFQVPDEQTHVAYVQQIAETGRPPVDEPTTRHSRELRAAMEGSRFGSLEARTLGVAIWSPPQQQRLETVLNAGLERHGNDDAGPSTPEPPLFYALEAVPYTLASGATLLDRMALMRLLSALMAGATALLAFLFVRECLPSRPWAWTVGGIGVAFAPMLGFVSGGVNPDALLFPVCAALFYCVARAFRRGLTMRLAVWIGVVLGVGAIAKINFYGLMPGALVAVALAARTADGRFDQRSARLVGAVVGIAVAPYALLTLLDALLWDRTFVLAHTPAESPRELDASAQVSHLWQVFLPRLPGQEVAFPEEEAYAGYELWFKGFVGRFGWIVVTFPEWAYRLAAGVLGVLGILVVRSLATLRADVRERRSELLSYGLMVGGLLLLIGMAAVRGFTPGLAAAAQGRYLLPLLALFAALLALAARAAGERWGRALGGVIVVVAIGWSLFGQLTTIEFFYG